MNWESFSAFIEMGGYAGYIWGSFGVTAACAVIEIISLGIRRRAILRERTAEHNC